MRYLVAGKARVHELAKELGVQSKTVMAKLREMGELVISASSTVEAPVARRLREEFLADASPGKTTWTPAARVGTSMGERDINVAAARIRGAASVPTLQPMTRPMAAHDIEVAAAEARAAALKAEQEAAVQAARAARERVVHRQRTADERATRLNPGHSAGVATSNDSTAAQVSTLLLLWDKLSSLAPNPDRCVDHLADRGGLPRSDVQRFRTVRNRCAHPAGRGWPTSYDLAMALTTGQELERRLTQDATRNRTPQS